MSAQRARSRTGCLTCKTRRKKCDETRPVCVRCRKSGVDCLGYSHLENLKGKAARIGSNATRLAPSPSVMPRGSNSSIPGPLHATATSASTVGMDSLSTSLANHSFLSLSSDIPQQDLFPMGDEHLQGLFSEFTPNDLFTNIDLFDVSFPSPTQVGSLSHLQLGGEVGEWGTNLTFGGNGALQSEPGTTGSNNVELGPSIGQPALGGSSIQYEGPDWIMDHSKAISSGRASLLNDLLSLGQPAAEHIKSVPAISYSSSLTPGSSRGSTWTSPETENEDEGSITSEDSDPEDIKEIVYGTLALDSTVESNSFPFVLQSYTHWTIQTVYEPLRLAHKIKDWAARRYAQSEDSRIGMTLFAGLINAICLKGAAPTDYIPVASMVGQRIRRRVIQATSDLALTTEADAKRANTLDEALEIIAVECLTRSVAYTIDLLTKSAPLFRRACPEPLDKTIDLASMFTHPNVNLRRFAVMDVLMATSLCQPMLFRYNICYDRELCNGIFVVEQMGLQWLNGIPDQIVLIMARINMLRNDFAPNIDPAVVAEIELELREFSSIPRATTDAYLLVARLAIQEFWRLVMFIYLYMGLCGADAKDSRVEKAHKSFMRLLEGTKSGRTPDSFLIMPMLLAGVATHRKREQGLIRQRMLALRECANPGTGGHDAVRVLEDIWARASVEGRQTVWEDLRISCARIIGV